MPSVAPFVVGTVLAAVAPDSAALPGQWWLIGGGRYDTLTVDVQPGGKVTGTLFGRAVAGTFDPAANRLVFELPPGKDSVPTARSWAGTLSRVRGSRPAEFRIVGTATGPAGLSYEWTAAAIRHCSPAADLHALAGRWSVDRVQEATSKERLPADLLLGETGSALEIRGNELVAAGRVVATLANDMPSPALAREVGFQSFRPLVLTLPGGKALVCSYNVGPTGVELAYPHTTSCHRGSGQNIYLKRPKE